jgi:hypothetical protein
VGLVALISNKGANMKKRIEKLKNRIERSLISRNLKLKQRIKDKDYKIAELKEQIKGQYDLINKQQDDYRQLDIKLRNIQSLLKKNELFTELEKLL